MFTRREIGTVAGGAGVAGALSNRVSLIDAWVSSATRTAQSFQQAWTLYRSFMRMNPMFVAAEARWQEITDQQFVAWIKAQGLDQPDGTGSSVGGRFYTLTKKMMQESLERTPEPMRSLVKSRMMQNPTLQSAMRNGEMAEQFEKSVR